MFCLGLYGLWRIAGWLLERQRAVVPWRKVRIIWPLFMLLWGWGIFWMLRSGLTDQWLVVMYAVFSFLNAPAMLLMDLAGEIAGNKFTLPDWQRYLFGSVLLWGSNFALVLLAEARAWSNIPSALNLEKRPDIVRAHERQE